MSREKYISKVSELENIFSREGEDRKIIHFHGAKNT
jgi:hypothetical protein